MSSSITKQLIVNKIGLPQDILNIIKKYVFEKIRRILKNDERYLLLRTIPCKCYDWKYGIFIYLPISDAKHLVLSYGDDGRLGDRIELRTIEKSYSAQFCTDYKVRYID